MLTLPRRPRKLNSVTQSKSNSFWGDDVLDSINNASRDEDNILDQIYHNIIRKCILTNWISTKTQYYDFLIVECCISLNMHFLKSLLKFKIFIIENCKYLLFIYLVKNATFPPTCHVKAVQDNISVETVSNFLSDCITLYLMWV